MENPPIDGAKYESATGDVCPACGQNLNAYQIFSMPFEACPHCRGLWLFKDELRELKNRVQGGSLRWLNDEIEALEKASVAVTEKPCVKCQNLKMVSVTFGKSSILIDWCPQCHGMWLDRGEFESIMQYLGAERQDMPSNEIEKRAVEDVKRIWTGSPEGRLEDALDAGKAISALVNATIFEHPRLFTLLNSLPRA
jgi:Zn-finger nucleic acid-binding protein